MSEPRNPKDLWIIRKPRPIGFEYDVFEFQPECTSDHYRKVPPSSPTPDAETAAQEWVNRHKPVHCATFAFNSHLAGQSIGEARRTREICEWLRSKEAKDIQYGCDTSDHLSDAIKNKFVDEWK